MARIKAVNIPAGVEVSIKGNIVTVKGPKGTVTKELPPVVVKIEDGSVKALSDDSMMANTALALIRSAIKGVVESYTKRLQIVYSHFPFTLEVKGKEVYIKNFLGEKIPRIAQLVGDTTLKVTKDIVEVSGTDRYAVGQTVANLKRATRIRQKDSRVFQDGMYTIE